MAPIIVHSASCPVSMCHTQCRVIDGCVYPDKAPPFSLVGSSLQSHICICHGAFDRICLPGMRALKVMDVATAVVGLKSHTRWG